MWKRLGRFMRLVRGMGRLGGVGGLLGGIWIGLRMGYIQMAACGKVSLFHFACLCRWKGAERVDNLELEGGAFGYDRLERRLCHSRYRNVPRSR